jgi:magnesium transporter
LIVRLGDDRRRDSSGVEAEQRRCEVDAGAEAAAEGRIESSAFTKVALSGNNIAMLNAFLFDDEGSERAEDWRAALDDIGRRELLWIALRDASEEEVSEVGEELEFNRTQTQRLRESPDKACVSDEGEHLHVTLLAVAGDDDAPLVVPIECVIGPKWVVTSHSDEIAVLEEFLERAKGGGQVGGLDAPSFVATISEWVVASYLRAFEAVEAELEELDARVIAETPRRDVSGELSRLVELRRRIGLLRRALAPHHEVVISLAHPELDKLSTDESARRFSALERRVTRALDAARETKESTFGSFDLLVARIGQRTNDIMKVLTLGTVILLPASALAGIMGMNFKVGLFGQAWLFWAVIAVMLVIAALVLATARVREWI